MIAVDYSYYTDVFGGTLLTADEWATLQARAQNAVDVATRFCLTDATEDALQSLIVKCYKFAICLQCESLIYEGLETSVTGNAVNSFSVGKVSVSKGGNSNAGASLLCVSAKAQLESVGLLNRGVAVAQEPYLPYPLGVV